MRKPTKRRTKKSNTKSRGRAGLATARMSQRELPMVAVEPLRGQMAPATREACDCALCVDFDAMKRLAKPLCKDMPWVCPKGA